MYILFRWLLSTTSIILSAYIIEAVIVQNFWSALWVSLVLGLVNAILRPILIVLTLPINILSLGLFTLVINALMVMLVSSIVKGFYVEGFWYAMLFSILVSVISYILNTIFETRK